MRCRNNAAKQATSADVTDECPGRPSATMVRGGLSGDHARIVNVSRPKRSAAGGDTAFGRQEGAAAIEGAPVGKACVGVEGRWYDVTPFTRMLNTGGP